MSATPHPRPLPSPQAATPVAPQAYNNAGPTLNEKLVQNWKPREGQEIDGKFRLLKQLGGSDHSVIFLTERAEEPKKAVIKIVPAINAENQILHWKLATKLPHPNLLRIFESGTAELNGHKLAYVVMEFAEEDLSQVLPLRALTATEARQMLIPVLDALSYLHGKGFVQGGIKPGNILAINDQLKLSSDSISAISEGIKIDGARTVTPYDPPETKLGKVSPASDVWALGTTLTEVLTQKKPVWDSKKQEPVLPKEVDESFRILIRNCLRPDAANRWTIPEIRSLLQPSKVPAAEVATRRRRPSVWLYVIPAVALLVLVGVLSRPGGLKPASTENVTAKATSERAKVAQPPAEKPAPTKITTPNPNPPATKPAPPVVTKAKAAALSAGSVLQKVFPTVPASASRTITGHIRVRVKVSVDEAGNVTQATLDDPGPSQYFARLSQEAAEKWKFSPAQAGGNPVPSEWFLHFSYGSNSTDAVANPMVHSRQ
jgi:TonB family protein